MTPEELKQIRERCEAATPGEWLGKENSGVVTGDGETIVFETGCGCCTESKITGADAAFIAHARTDVPALLDEVERLRAIIGGGGLTYSEGEVSLRAQLASALADAKTLMEERDEARDSALMFERDWKDACRERDELRAWQLKVAEPIGYVVHAWGTGGYDVAEPSIIVDAWRAMERERDEARREHHAHCEARAVELYDRAKAAEEELAFVREEYGKARNEELAEDALCMKIAVLVRERDEAVEEREMCRKCYEAECEKVKTLERELGKR